MIDLSTPPLGILKAIWNRLTKWLFLEAYVQSDLSKMRRRQLGRHWHQLGKRLEFGLRMESVCTNENPPLSHIAIKSKDESIYAKVVVNVTAISGSATYQDTITFINVNKHICIAALPSIPLMNIWIAGDGFRMSYEDINTTIVELVDSEGDIVDCSHMQKSYLTPMNNEINEGVARRWNRYWNLGEITDQKNLIARKIYYYVFFHADVYRNRPLTYYPRRLLFKLLTKDFVINILFWSKNLVKARQLSAAIEEQERNTRELLTEEPDNTKSHNQDLDTNDIERR